MESYNNQINLQTNITEDETAEENTAVLSDEKNKRPPLYKRIIKSKFFSKKMKALIWVFLGSVIVYLLSRISSDFAEFWTRYPAQGIRFALAMLTNLIPFSLAEVLLLSIPVFAIGYIVASNIATRKDESDETFYRWTRPLVSVFLIIFIILFTAFAPAYGRYKLAKNLGLEQQAVNKEDLVQTGIVLTNLIKEDLQEVTFDSNGASVMPYDYYTLAKKLNQAYKSYAAEETYISHFYSNPKPIALSEPMLYTHISGVYTFMTGESNVNTQYPDFLMPFTMAHEMAHQRGIAREDEANFVAFLVCINSADPYIRYSGYANLINYMSSAIANEDATAFKNFSLNYMPKELLGEFIAYSTFFDKYRDSVASDITGAVNDVFLQSQGQSAGIKSYGLVVDLAVAYYKQ